MWVASAVVAEAELKERAAAFAHFVEVATHCVELRNYNAAQEVSAGLALAAVHRLKVTKAALPAEAIAQYDALQALVSIDGNRKAYRHALLSATPPCIPYLGVYLTDLTFIEDGNKDEVEVAAPALTKEEAAPTARRRRAADQLGEQKYAAVIEDMSTSAESTACPLALQRYLRQLPSIVLDEGAVQASSRSNRAAGRRRPPPRRRRAAAPASVRTRQAAPAQPQRLRTEGVGAVDGRRRASRGRRPSSCAPPQAAPSHRRCRRRRRRRRRGEGRGGRRVRPRPRSALSPRRRVAATARREAGRSPCTRRICSVCGVRKVTRVTYLFTRRSSTAASPPCPPARALAHAPASTRRQSASTASTAAARPRRASRCAAARARRCGRRAAATRGAAATRRRSAAPRPPPSRPAARNWAWSDRWCA